jgi:6-phosphofructokinase
MSKPCLGILVGGGPAPGINGVIGAAAIEAINSGMRVTGLYDGFQWLAGEDFDVAQHTVDLQIRDVARIHFDGGSILRTARTSLLDDAKLKTSMVVASDGQKVKRVLSRLELLGITHLLTIGGDDTVLSVRFVAEASHGKLRIVHCPKTIDNDLPLPGDTPTFGFSTARHHGAQLVANLMEDSRTTSRWYLIVAMGRHAGFLALGIGKSAGATFTLIPEEFTDRVTVSQIADVIEAAMLKRRAMGRRDGVGVIAEGVAERLGDRAELERLLDREIPVDAAGHPRLAEVPLDSILKQELARRFKQRGDELTLVAETLGYELRCAPPTPYDMAYCRDLGHGSVRILLDTKANHPPGVMVTLQGGHLKPMFFDEMIDPETNRTRIRLVDLSSDSYRVARAYMIRLTPQDLESDDMVAKLAGHARMTPQEFRERYRPVVDGTICKVTQAPRWALEGQRTEPY